MSGETAAILLGFQYARSDKYRLPVVFDLYLAYRYLRRALGPSAPILVATDAGRGEGVCLVGEEDLTNSISSGHADYRIAAFVDFLLGAPHADRNLRLRPCSSLADLRGTRDQFTCREKSKLFLYYSGHGEENSLLLPSLERVPGETFLSWALEVGPRQVFCLADCCHLGSCRLPYSFQPPPSRERKGWAATLRPPPSTNYIFRRQRVALLLSSEGEAHGDNFGSFFTRKFFSALEAAGAPLLWEDLLSPQSALYFSYPERENIWPWLLC